MSGAGREAGPTSADTAPEWVIDLTTAGPIAEAAQLAVDELQSALGGGPWCIAIRGSGEVLAASGPLGTAPIRVHALPVPGLDLLAVDASDGQRADPEQERRTIERIGRLVAVVVDAERRAATAVRKAREAEALATVDSLTGLLDQGEWWRRVSEFEAQLRRNPREVAIVIVDLDGLKTANDTRGHLHGDLLIRLAAQTLTDVVRTGDLVARVGGDEFAVLAVDHGSTAAALSERIAGALAEAGIPASVGARVHRPGASLRTTYAGADRAMYEDKRRRRGDPPDRWPPDSA